MSRLNAFYAVFSGSDTVLILINADPDSIASSAAVKRLLWRRVSSVTVSHINLIERPDNQALVKYLTVPNLHVSKINPGDYSKVILVDSQPDHHTSFSRFAPDVIIDHHPIKSATAKVLDIRPEYGATASIVTEYLRAAKIKPSVKLATGLFLAIKVDTDNFRRRAVPEDLRAFQYLYRFANLHLVRKIEQTDLKPSFLKFFSIALERRLFSKGRVFSHLGKLPTSDICVLIADFFMKVDSVKWCFVSGVYKNRLVIVIRTDGFYKNA
jgi:nanoRNase/pAp phosphatase (c-di-AMP/oligoRNAs hydrolase)